MLTSTHSCDTIHHLAAHGIGRGAPRGAAWFPSATPYQTVKQLRAQQASRYVVGSADGQRPAFAQARWSAGLSRSRPFRCAQRLASVRLVTASLR
jgi:hypothetical protein